MACFLVALIVILALALTYYVVMFQRQKRQCGVLLDELNQSTAQQTFFMRKMIHEMNTPLSAIELNVSTLLKERCCTHSVEMIKSSARMLATIYEDIAFHVGKEKICYPAQWIDLESFVADRMLYFDTMASVKNIFLEMQSDPECYVYISKTELQRIVDNTLSNAIKYSTSASPIIDITIIHVDGAIELIFKDTGIGMSDDEVKNLFVSYYRGMHNAQGLGLGMSIIKKICDDYDIVIRVQSKKREGSLFSYTFPPKMVTKDPSANGHP
ncbi:MAG: HAMP domain-containing histidine kinase [Campylobacterales bacterium]|nr:HAMP domain-containing histidine kinase [Campylobacterales bacterium]